MERIALRGFAQMRSAPAPADLLERILQALGLPVRTAGSGACRPLRTVLAGALVLTLLLSVAILAAPQLARHWLMLAVLRFNAEPSPTYFGGKEPDSHLPRASDRATALARDPRLQKKAAVAQKSRPLRDLLQALTKELGVRLVPNRAIADEKITLFLRDRPASELLSLVAEHLDFAWYRDGNGYELTQDAGGRQREAALRREELSAQLAALQRRMDGVVRLAGLSQAQLKARAADMEMRLGDAGLTREQREALEEEKAALEDLDRTGARAAAAIYRSLTPEQVRQLLDGNGLSLRTDQGTLPPALADPVHGAVLEKWRKMGGSEAFAVGAYHDFDRLPPSEADVVVFLAEQGDAGFGPPPLSFQNVRLEFQMSSTRGMGPDRAPDMVSWSPGVRTSSTPSKPVTTQTDDPELTREVELKLAKPERPKPSINGISASFFDGAWPIDPTLGDVAEALHAASGLEVVADSYVRARPDAQDLTGRRTVVQILDGIANSLHYTWEKRGRVIRLRDRLYFRDRPMEVPERIVGSWRERVAAAGGTPTLDDLGEIAAALTDPQCRGLQDYWGWYLEQPRGWITKPHPPSGLYNDREHLRMWASLSPAQRRAVAGGATLPVQAMSGLQRTAFTNGLTARPASAYSRYAQGQLEVAPTPAAVLSGGFAFRRSDKYNQEYMGRTADGKLTGVSSTGEGRAPKGDVKFPGFEGVDLKPQGPPVVLNTYAFLYYLGGSSSPARRVEIMVPESRPWPKR